MDDEVRGEPTLSMGRLLPPPPPMHQETILMTALLIAPIQARMGKALVVPLELAVPLQG